MISRLCLLIVITIAGVACRPALAADSIPGLQQFRAMQREYKAQEERYHNETIKDVTDDAERERLSHLSPANAMVDAFLRLEGQYRGTVVGLSTLHHLVSRFSHTPHADREGARDAIEILTDHYGDHKDLDVFFFWLRAGSCSQEAKTLLRRALESPHRHVRGNALFKLAAICGTESEMPVWSDANLELVGDDAGLAKQATLFRMLKKRFADVDVQVSRREAIQLCKSAAARQYNCAIRLPKSTATYWSRPARRTDRRSCVSNVNPSIR